MKLSLVLKMHWLIFIKMKNYIRNKGQNYNGYNTGMQETFFHMIASTNKRKKIITSLNIEGQEARDFSLMEKYIFQYYKELLGTIFGLIFQISFGMIVIKLLLKKICY
jgi:hypothetical protein